MVQSASSVCAYDPAYAPDWPGHVFPAEKYRLVAERITGSFLRPDPATWDELALVHTRDYLNRIQAMTSDPRSGYVEFEIPVSAAVIDAFRMQTGGSILAALTALDKGAAANLGGGFHHAFSDRGEGFCLVNDLAVLIRVLQNARRIKTAAVIDLDVHQGNGTAAIFKGDRDVFTFSMHQEDLYPVKQRSSLDVGLYSGTGDDEYLTRLQASLPKALAGSPDLVVYQAGADPFKEDRLGGLQLTKNGLATRDAMVFEETRQRGLPVVLTLGGGYSLHTEDVVEIHVATIQQMITTMFR